MFQGENFESNENDGHVSRNESFDGFLQVGNFSNGHVNDILW